MAVINRERMQTILKTAEQLQKYTPCDLALATTQPRAPPAVYHYLLDLHPPLRCAIQSTMTFIAAFHTFTIELNHSDREIFTSFRIKIPRHELESQHRFYARILAYTHAYRIGIHFTDEISEPREPTIEQRSSVGAIQLWTQVGAPDKRKLELSLKQHPDAEHRIYFYAPDDLATFCHHLRGSKTNWIESVQFYQLDLGLLERLIENESSSPHWNLSFIDNRIYLSVNNIELESEVLQLDIWAAFQESLSQHSPFQ